MVGTEIGPFVIESELGSGAMGTVYRALYRDTGKTVAIKIIAMGLTGNETAMKRFEREATILKQLKHPNIVRLLATGRYRKTPFFAMEFVEGTSLDHVLHRKKKLSWEEVVQIGTQLCAALKHAHDQNITHRDLKPSNLMMLKDGTVKLTDFGIAKDAEMTALTGANCTVGTASYMSPEQCRGERTLTYKSDLYSMGVVFYELLTGEKPFKADSPVDMFLAHVNRTAERPSRKVMDIPPWLDTLVMQLLEKKPDHRPRDAAMVAEVLKEIKEKAEAQQSAGVDAVMGRSVEATVSHKFTDTADQKAARELRGAVLKKKVKRKGGPWYEAKAVQAGGLVLALVVVCGLFYQFVLRPKSPEELYGRAKDAQAAGDLDKLRAAYAAFEAHYADRTDPTAVQLRDWYQEAEVAQAEKRFLYRYRKGWNAEDPGEATAFAALRNEEAGDAVEAAEQWKKLEQAGLAATPPVSAWLARKKLADLDELKRREQGLLSRVEDARVKGQPIDLKALPDEEKRALDATRYEAFGDLPAARDRWQRLKDDTLREPKARDWLVLAARKGRELRGRTGTTPDADKQFRKKWLQDKLDGLDRDRDPMNPAWLNRARWTYRDVADLYRTDPDGDLAEFAKAAEQKLRELPGK